MNTHIMCIGWPTIRRLAADGSVWFDELQCGAVADDELHGADIDAMLNSTARIEALEAQLVSDIRAETEIERLECRIEVLEAALRFLLDTKWKSVDKDNMEFEGRVTCYQLDKARNALAQEQDK